MFTFKQNSISFNITDLIFMLFFFILAQNNRAKINFEPLSQYFKKVKRRLCQNYWNDSGAGGVMSCFTSLFS